MVTSGKHNPLGLSNFIKYIHASLLLPLPLTRLKQALVLHSICHWSFFSKLPRANLEARLSHSLRFLKMLNPRFQWSVPKSIILIFPISHSSPLDQVPSKFYPSGTAFSPSGTSDSILKFAPCRIKLTYSPLENPCVSPSWTSGNLLISIPLFGFSIFIA